MVVTMSSFVRSLVNFLVALELLLVDLALVIHSFRTTLPATALEATLLELLVVL